MPKNHLKEGKHKTKILRVLLLKQKEKCIHVSTRSSPRSYSVSLWLFYSLPLSQFSYSRLFADGKVSNPTRRRRKMYANHSTTIWLTRLCCFLGKGRKRLPSKKKKLVVVPPWIVLFTAPLTAFLFLSARRWVKAKF